MMFLRRQAIQLGDESKNFIWQKKKKNKWIWAPFTESLFFLPRKNALFWSGEYIFIHILGWVYNVTFSLIFPFIFFFWEKKVVSNRTRKDDIFERKIFLKIEIYPILRKLFFHFTLSNMPYQSTNIWMPPFGCQATLPFSHLLFCRNVISFRFI